MKTTAFDSSSSIMQLLSYYYYLTEESKSIHRYSNHRMDWKQYIVSQTQSNQDQCGQVPDLEFVCYLTVCQAHSSMLLLGGLGAFPQDFYMLRDGIRWLFWPDIAAEYPFHHCCILHVSTLQLASQLYSYKFHLLDIIHKRFLNQARTGHNFLKLFLCRHVCVCVPAPEAINKQGCDTA